jgi:dihydrofolate reductase
VSTAVKLAPLAMVCAMARNRVIGNKGQLPWHEPEDLKHFKAVTTGHAVVMGRKTWEALGKPLPKRRNLVVTRQPGFRAAGAEVFAELDAAIAAARATDPQPCVIGGGEIYTLALPQATLIHLTVVDMEPAGDAWFPELDDRQWRERERRESGRLVFRTLERILPA